MSRQTVSAPAPAPGVGQPLTIANHALESAHQRLVAGPAKILHTTPPVPVRSTGFAAVAPADRYTFLQGRAWALDMARSMRAMPTTTLIERMAGAVVGKPVSYAAGVQSVIQTLQEASQ